MTHNPCRLPPSFSGPVRSWSVSSRWSRPLPLLLLMLAGVASTALAATLPEQEELNDTCPGQAVPCGSIIQPAMLEGYSDYDHYSFQVAAGVPITVGTDDPGGFPFSDTVVDLLNASCTSTLATDNNSGPRGYSLISGYTAPYTGTYVLRVRSDLSSLPQPYLAFIYCGPPPTGGCCLASGACQILNRVQCAAQNAEYHGDGTGCAEVDCAAIIVNEQCESAVEIPVPGEGMLSGDSFFAQDDYSPSYPSCTGGPNAGGDIVYRLDLAPGDFVRARYTQERGDATIYLLSDCAEPEVSCVAGVDAAGYGQTELLEHMVGTPPSGACCYPDQSCVVLTEQTCLATGGLWRGQWTTCDPNYCYMYHGACCLPAGGCLDSDPWECAELGGTYAGDGVMCYWQPCPRPPGACCFAGGGCQLLDGQQCMLAAGFWLGEGTACEPNPCTGSFGACCFADQSCRISTPEDCVSDGGTYAGDLVRCESAGCGAPLGACCLANGYCVVVTGRQCDDMRGSWMGEWTDTCDPNPCPAGKDAPIAPASGRQPFYLVLDAKYEGTTGPWTLEYLVLRAANVDDEAAVAAPDWLRVSPNPSRGVIRISYAWGAGAGEASSIEIFDPAGRVVRTFTPTDAIAGETTWDGLTGRGERAPSGVYFVRLRAGDRSLSRTVLRVD